MQTTIYHLKTSLRQVLDLHKGPVSLKTLSRIQIQKIII